MGEQVVNDQQVTLGVGVLKDTASDEKRVALTPDTIPSLARKQIQVLVERGAGTTAGFLDSAYQEAGAEVLSRDEVVARSRVLVQVRSLGAVSSDDTASVEGLGEQHTLIATMDPLSNPQPLQTAAQRNLTCFALEMMPRITRAQSMDVLSSMATVAGYKAVILAADTLPKLFPMMMTAAGTITPAKVFVIGAGVAGLQACATAKRLGAVVEAYDVRPAVKDQVTSVGASFVEFDLEAESAEDRGGYAKAQSDAFYQKQRELMKEVVSRNDVVITTAAIPGHTAPILVTREMVHAMQPGSVVIDLAAERGGNCECTRAGETVLEEGVSILGPVNLPATLAYHASRMLSKNISTFLLHLAKEGELILDLEDEITRETLMTHQGDVVHPRIREALSLAPLES